MSRTATEANLVSIRDMLPKRLRTARKVDISGFRSGSIIRAKLRNFMSYSLAEFHFGPRMNLIVGPNGSGKSTFVCAVCIALAGKLDFLGKASMTVDQFIKMGERQGYIELEMKAQGQNETVVIRRTLSRDAKSTWYVDGQQATENSVRALLKASNIELGNLCQFLPQDRVAKFASLKPEELLRELERIYQDGKLLEQHERLDALYGERRGKRRDAEDAQRRLTELRQRQQALEEHAAQLREFRRLEDELRRLGSVRTYARLEARRVVQAQSKEEYRSAVEAVRGYERQVGPWRAEIAQMAASATDHLETSKQHAAAQEKYKARAERRMAALDGIGGEIERLESKKEYISTRMEARIQKLRGLTQELAQCEQTKRKIDLLDAAQMEVLRADREKYTAQAEAQREQGQALRERVRELVKEHERCIQSADELRKQLGSNDRLLTLDRRRFGNVIECVKLVRREGAKLHLNCFEPPAVSVRVKDPRCAPALERLVRATNMNAFTISNGFEYDKLTKFLYDEHYRFGRGVSVRTLGRSAQDPQQLRGCVSAEALQRLGFAGFVSDFIDGPPEVVRMLCENEDLHNTPICFGEMPAQQIEALTRRIASGELKFRRVVIGDSIYQFMRSSFGRRQLSTVIRTIPQRSAIFGGGISEEQRQQVAERIAELDAQAEKQADAQAAADAKAAQEAGALEKTSGILHEIRAKMSHQRNQQEALVKCETRISTLRDELEVEKRALRKMKRREAGARAGGGSAEQSEMRRLLAQLRAKRERQIDMLAGIEPVIGKMCAQGERAAQVNLQRLEEENRRTILSGFMDSAEVRRQELAQQKQAAKEKFVTVKVEYQAALEKYRREVECYSAEKRAQVRETIEQLKQRSLLSPEGVAAEENRVKSAMRLQRSGTGGASFSIEMLEQNERAIAQLEQQVPQLQDSLRQAQQAMDEVLRVWKPQLDQLVKRIGADFGASMAEVASAGDVRLDCESENYAEWKLRILVSFRDSEEMVQLNAAQQSGGEKSVTTAVFLNSLQGLTNTPFRIVDEINQGMDSHNERRVHEMIVRKATSVVGASQYFLITPKLLTDLFYTEDMDIHCIFAGMWLPPCEDKPQFLEMGELCKFVGSD